MFASKTLGQVVVNDGEVEVTVKIRKLSRRQLFTASEAQSEQAARQMNRMNPEVLRGIHAAGQEELKRREEAEKNKKLPFEINYSAYDVETVLLAGIVSWSVPVDVQKGIEDLDEATSQKIFKAILDLSIEKVNETPKG